MKNEKLLSYRIPILVVLAVIFTALVIFFTPLRYTTFIEPTIQDVEPEEIYEKMQQNPEEYFFIDTRSPVEFKNIHADGSINIPLAQFYDKWRELPKTGKEIVLICTGGRQSGVGYFFLEHFGFTNIVRVSGGLQNWTSKDLPVTLLETVF